MAGTIGHGYDRNPSVDFTFGRGYDCYPSVNEPLGGATQSIGTLAPGCRRPVWNSDD